MEANEDYAVFIHFGIPVVTRIGSKVYNTLVEMEKQYFTGTSPNCEKFADDLVVVAEREVV